MWSVVSHAGTGLAVAGLSATYYALARKNVEMERQNLVNEYDGEDVNVKDIQESVPMMTTSQLLLKNELELITRGSGHSMGLNVIEGVPQQQQQQQQLDIVQSVPSHYSGMNVRQIVSRVQSSIPIKGIFSNKNFENELDDEIETIKGPSTTFNNNQGHELVYLTDDADDKKSPSKTSKMTNNNEGESSQSVFDVEELSKLNISDESIQQNEEEPQDPTTCNNISSEDNLLQRTKSPIVYYKNPGFGNRFACKIPKQNSSSFENMARDSSTDRFESFNKQDIREDLTFHSQVGQSYKDSTQFLFPPVLSESKLSVCDNDEDNNETIIRALEKALLTQDEETIGNSDDTSLDPHQVEMDEIRDYNLQLKILQKVKNTDGSGFLNDTPLSEPEDIFDSVSELFPSEKGKENISQEKEKYIPSSSKVIFHPEFKHFKTEEKENHRLQDGDHLNVHKTSSEFQKDVKGNTMEEWKIGDGYIKEEGDVNRYPLVVESETSIIERIPDNSWICLPARVYAEAVVTPPVVMLFLSLVVVVFGILGKFFIGLADWFELNEIDEDINALMEH